MTIIHFMRTFAVFALATIVFTSCSKEEVLPEENQNIAFSTNSQKCRVWTGERVNSADIDFKFVAKVYGNVVGITEEQDADGRFFQLGFIVTNDADKPGAVYGLVDPVAGTWEKLDACKKKSIAGFWDGLSRVEARDARIIQQGTNRNSVYLFYGTGSVRNFKRFRVDNGEVLKEFGRGGTLPPGFGAGRLFYHDSNRADFPANWLGLRNQRLHNFGSNLNSDPVVIPVRRNGFNGEDLNNNITAIQGYWPFNNQRIVLERNGRTITLQKERKDGVNFYKGR